MWLRGWVNQTAASLWVAVVSMVLVFALGRLLGPERFGEYNYVLTLASLIAILQDGGFKTLLQRESAHRSMDLDAGGLTRYALGHILWVSLAACAWPPCWGRIGGARWHGPSWRWLCLRRPTSCPRGGAGWGNMPGMPGGRQACAASRRWSSSVA